MKDPVIIRFPSHEVNIGGRPLGGSHPIRLQSMTNTPTVDVQASIAQCIRIMEAGADYVRLSVPNQESVEAFGRIGQGLRAAGFHQPLVADIHFNPELALRVAPLAAKVRINPGNYVDRLRRTPPEWTAELQQQEMENIRHRISPLVKVCREHGTVLRIGTNFGSLSQRIVHQYGNTPQAMVQATLEFLEVLEDLGFTQSVVSLKASNPLVMAHAYRLMVQRMLAKGMTYPLHLGVTEAGAGENGRIRSALGMAPLLEQGIGDTIRVSLSEPPEHEIPFAQKLAHSFNKRYRQQERPGQYVLPETPAGLPPTPALPGGHKAVVTGNQLQHPVRDKASISYHTQPINDTNPLVADLLFSEQPGTAPAEGGFLLIPASRLQQKDAEGIVPLFDRGHLTLENHPWHGSFNALLLNTLPAADTLPSLGKAPGLLLMPDLPTFDAKHLQPLHQMLQQQGIPAAIIPRITLTTADTAELTVKLATLFGGGLMAHEIHGLWVQAPNIAEHTLNPIVYGLLQAAGVRITATEFISCPTCARTSYDLMKVLEQVQQQAAHLPGLKIAIMGCVVNGPGEMADADYGILGTATGKVHIYKGSTPLLKNLDPAGAAAQLMEIIAREEADNHY